jgi:hypothetical protein
LGLGLAVCAGILTAVLGLVASQEPADANPAQSDYRGRPQHTLGEEKATTLRQRRDNRLLETSVAAIRDALDGMSGREGETFDALLRRWTRRDPASAAERAAERSGRRDELAAGKLKPTNFTLITEPPVSCPSATASQ